jgi:hypothetical protein
LIRVMRPEHIRGWARPVEPGQQLQRLRPGQQAQPPSIPLPSLGSYTVATTIGACEPIRKRRRHRRWPAAPATRWGRRWLGRGRLRSGSRGRGCATAGWPPRGPGRRRSRRSTSNHPGRHRLPCRGSPPSPYCSPRIGCPRGLALSSFTAWCKWAGDQALLNERGVGLQGDDGR